MSALTLPLFEQPAVVGTQVAQRTEDLVRDHREKIYRRTDRLFAGLMALQWLGVLIAAYWVAPRTWEGLSSQVHPHVWTALFLGGAVSFFPILLALLYPGRTLTRHVIAIGQLLMSGLLIHFTGGRSESHFHIFGSLAFLAFYRDWRVLLTASLVTAADHALRGFFWPLSIYGVAVVEPWRWVEHTGWVVFTDTFLIVSIAQSVREMRGIAWQQAKQEEAESNLQSAHDHLERRVQKRTLELAQANTALKDDIAERKRLEAERELALLEALERANRDPLTGLLNHRTFHSRLEEESVRTLCAGTILTVALLDLDNFRFFNDCYGHAVGDEVLRLVAQRLQSICESEAVVVRFGGDEFALLLPDVGYTRAAEAEEWIREGLNGLTFRPEGQASAIPISVSVGAALFPHTGQDRQDVLRQAGERLLWVKTGGAVETEAQQVRASVLRRVQGFSMLDALVTAVDNKDRYTRRHSEDVMAYSLTIARALGMDEATQRTVAVAALLHDVGKIGVPDAILRKPGKLTEEEFEAIKQHPQMGAIMVGAVPGLEETLDAVRHHHERWDGAGYPFGLAGDQTPLIARLMAVADAFSAMTTDRPYRKGMDKKKAFSILRDGAGTQWDPECVDAFLCSEKN